MASCDNSITLYPAAPLHSPLCCMHARSREKLRCCCRDANCPIVTETLQHQNPGTEQAFGRCNRLMMVFLPRAETKFRSFDTYAARARFSAASILASAHAAGCHGHCELGQV